MSAAPSLDEGPGGSAGEDDLTGTSAGPYRLLRRLGKGGDGAVYLGEDPLTGWRAAIKFLHPRHGSDPAALRRFFNEAHAAHAIGHENIARITDLDRTSGGRHFLVMELLDGEPLDALIARSGALPVALALPILAQCCEALHAAHERGIVHADLKPENVFLVTERGRERFVKIVDFGMARLDDAPEGARRNVVLGTPWYMSPEQALGEPFDRRSDVYSLGVILFEMVTGRVPFPYESEQAMVAHVEEPPPAPRSLAPQLSPALEALILRALSKDPGGRPPTMLVLRDELRAATPRARRRTALFGAALGGAALLIAALAVAALTRVGEGRGSRVDVATPAGGNP